MADYLKATGREDIAKEAEKYKHVMIFLLPLKNNFPS